MKILKHIFAITLLITVFSVTNILLGTNITYAENNFCTAQELQDNVPGCYSEGFVAPDQEKIDDRINEKSFRTQVMKIVNYFLTFLGLAAIIAIVYAGVLMVTDFGGGENNDKAKQIILWAGIGIIVVLISYSYVNWVLDAGGPSNNTTQNGNGETFTPEGDNTNLNNSGEVLTGDNGEVLIGDDGEVLTGDNGEVLIGDNGEVLIGDDGEVLTTNGSGLSINNNILKGEPEINQALDNIENQLDQIDFEKTDEDFLLAIQQLKTGLEIIYNNMPKTAENIAAYEDVLTLLADLELDPTKEKLFTLKESINKLKELIKRTPQMKARIKSSHLSGKSPLTVSFDATESEDPNNQTIPHSSFVWSYKDKNGSIINIGTGPIIDYTFIEIGLYVINLTIKSDTIDGVRLVRDGFASSKIKILPPDSNLKIYIGGTEVKSIFKINILDAKKGLVFDASQSISKKGVEFIEYRWIFGDGNEDFSETGDPIVHNYSESETYKAKLVVTDNTGNIIEKHFRIKVENLTAKITMTPNKGDTNTDFSFSAVNSKSIDTQIQSYLWEIKNKSGEIIKANDKKKIIFNSNTPGQYVATLIIIDSTNDSSTDSVQFNVNSQAPNAYFSSKMKSKSQPSIIIFNAIASTDPTGDQVLYSWDFNGDNKYEKIELEEAKIEHNFTKEGAYTVVLKVSDKYGMEAYYRKNIEIKSILNVDFNMSNTAIQKESKITFTPIAKKSKSFYWDFGDDQNVVTDKPVNVEHKYKKAGKYLVKLKVFNTDGEENSISKYVFVGDKTHPVAAFQIAINGQTLFPEEDICGEDLGIEATRKDFIEFSATKSINIDGQNYDLAYTWDFGDNQYSNQKVATHQFNELNTDKCFKVKLTVKDKKTNKTNSTDDLFIKINNISPEIINLSIHEDENIKSRITPYEVKLKAHGTRDLDGTIKEYLWWYRKLGDPLDTKKGVIKTQTPNTSLIIDSEGVSGLENEYVFGVEITDNEDLITNSEEILGTSPSLLVINGNVESPKLELIADKNQIYSGDTVSFFANVTDSQGRPMTNISYEWDFNGDGVIDDHNSGNQVAREFNTIGEFDVRLKVKYKGLTTTANQKIFVDKITKYPLAAFTFTTDGLTVFGDASTSRFSPALEDTHLRIFWDFDKTIDSDGDGDSQNDKEMEGIKANYTYKEQGVHYITLLVIDSLGSKDTVVRRVEVERNEDEINQMINKNGEKSSIIITSPTNALTSLDLTVNKQEVSLEDTLNITARVINADSSVYEENVVFTIIKGEGVFDEEIVKAKNNLAINVFTPLSEGDITILVTAEKTFYNDIEEQIDFKIISTETIQKETPDLSTSEINVREIRKEEEENTINNLQ